MVTFHLEKHSDILLVRVLVQKVFSLVKNVM